MSDLKIAAEDAHDRVAVLFHVPDQEGYVKNRLLAVNVKWIILNGTPKDPLTGEFMKYEGTHIIQ